MPRLKLGRADQTASAFASSSPSPAKHPVRALILAPTRELALQVYESVKAYSKHTHLRSMCAFGGVDIKPQIAELKKGVEILVATPGRLLDHVENKSPASCKACGRPSRLKEFRCM